MAWITKEHTKFEETKLSVCFLSMVSMSLCLSSSFIPSPIPYTKFPTAEDPIFRVTRFSVSAPLKTSVSASSTRKPAPATKTRNPKDKEFSQTLFFECMEKTPIKKKKKKKEKRKSEKVWVHTLPEVLYYHIHKKNWAITLEVSHHPFVLHKLHPFLFGLKNYDCWLNTWNLIFLCPINWRSFGLSWFRWDATLVWHYFL